MSSSSSTSSQPLSSSSSSSIPYNAAPAAVGAHDNIPGPSTGEFEGPSSSSRQRAMNEIWPEPVVEALATQVAFDASHYHGRLAAASALAVIFQVCSTWREVSRSELLWQGLTRQIWLRNYRSRDTWQLEYMYWHQTARNFTTGRHQYASLVPDEEALICRCLTLSDTHLACGFIDGTVRLFDLHTRAHLSTFCSSTHTHLFGPFSRSVSGIISNSSALAFARLDGDIYVAIINGGPIAPRRAIPGDVVNNGVLVEFDGCSGYWVALFAGHAGSAFQIWDSLTEHRLFVGGSLTDPETVLGWHMLTDLVEPLGRIRVIITQNEEEYVIACTASRLVCFNLRNPEVLLRDVGSTSGFVVGSLDVSNHGFFLVVERNGVGSVRRVGMTFQRLSRFRLRGSWIRGGLLARINLGYVLLYSGGFLRVWDIHHPAARLCATLAVLGDGGPVSSIIMVANQTHIAISSHHSSLHLLDFSVR